MSSDFEKQNIFEAQEVKKVAGQKAAADSLEGEKKEGLVKRLLKNLLVLSEMEISRRQKEEEAQRQADAVKERLNDLGYFFYFFWSGIDTNTASEFIKQTQVWRVLNPDKRRIIICLNTPGGYVIDTDGLGDYCEYLKGKGYEVTVFVMGEAASAGIYALTLASEGRRIVAPRSWILIHEAMWDYQGPVTAQHDNQVFNERLWKQFAAVVAERSPRYRGKVAELMEWVSGHQRWMTAYEAVEYGFADTVGYIDEL